MEPSNNSLKLMAFSGLAEDYPTWSTRFSTFAQTYGLFKTLTDTVELPDRPTPLREDTNNAQMREQTQARATTVQEDESRKNQISCYLAVTLDASSFMLICHDCVNNRGLGDGQKAWRIFQQSFRIDEISSHKSDEAVPQTTTSRGRNHPPVLHQSAKVGHPLASRSWKLSETLLNEMVLNGLLQR